MYTVEARGPQDDTSTDKAEEGRHVQLVEECSPDKGAADLKAVDGVSGVVSVMGVWSG